MMRIKLSPSLLASDFACLGQQAREMIKAGADMLHIDVMDGHFVPNITLGPPVVASLRRCTDAFFDVHLMIDRPGDFLEPFCKAGADLVTLHVESEGNLSEMIVWLHTHGKKAGLSVSPRTDISAVYPYLDQLDQVLVMTVEPGFGGQSFLPETLPKIRAVRAQAQKQGLSLDVQVDGGIHLETARQAASQGANVLVAGSFLFGSADYAQAVSALRRAAEESYRE